MLFPTYEPSFPKEGPIMNESEIPAPLVPRELRCTKGPERSVLGHIEPPWQSEPGSDSKIPIPMVPVPRDDETVVAEVNTFFTPGGRPLEEVLEPSVRKFQKDDRKKTPFDMLPFDALDLVAQVMRFGAYETPRPDGTRGYGRDNWKECTDNSRYDSAMLRHYAAIQRGETIDPDSGLPHRAHLACDALFALWIEQCK